MWLETHPDIFALEEDAVKAALKTRTDHSVHGNPLLPRF